MKDSIIKFKSVNKYYGTVEVLRDFSYNFRTGNSYVICGPSGCGKTTLLRLIAGLELPDAGEIYLNEALVSKRGWAIPPHRRGIGFIFQAPSLWPHMTVGQNIQFGLQGISKGNALKRLKELLEMTELTGLENRYPDQISGGQAKRVSLARTLAPKPQIILADEPLSNLEADLKDKLLKDLNKYIRMEKAFLIYVTHVQAEAEQISANILRMKGGGLGFE